MDRRVAAELSRVIWPTESVRWSSRLADADWSRVLATAAQQRVLPTVLSRMAVLASDRFENETIAVLDRLWTLPGTRRDLGRRMGADRGVPCLKRLRRAVDQFRHDLVTGSMAACGALEAVGLEPMVVKGMAVAQYYPAGHDRLFMDCDIATPAITGVWRALGALGRAGYSVVAFDVGRRGKRLLAPKVELENARGTSLDLHVGGFPTGGVGFLEAPLWHRSAVGNEGARYPSREDAVLMLCGHVVRQGYVCLRDIDDAYVLLFAPGVLLDRRYLNVEARRSNLSHILSVLIRLVHERYPTSSSVRRRPALTGDRLSAQLLAQSRLGRMSTTLLPQLAHTFPFTFKRHGFRIAVHHAVGTALKALENDLWFLERRLRGVPVTAVRGARRLLLSALTARWRISSIPVWGDIRLHPVTPNRPAEGLAIARGHYRIYRSVAGATASITPDPTDPDYLVTPAGVFFSTGYTGLFPRTTDFVERQAGTITVHLRALKLDSSAGHPGRRQCGPPVLHSTRTRDAGHR